MPKSESVSTTDPLAPTKREMEAMYMGHRIEEIRGEIASWADVLFVNLDDLDTYKTARQTPSADPFKWGPR